MASIIVKRSNIEGLGVFAARDFKKGEVVICWDTSHQLTPQEAKRVTPEEQRYVAYLNGVYILMQPPARYVNHSCEANTYAKDFCDIAKRDIRKGEEITSDYSEDAPGEMMVCHCGSKNCRKIIRA